MYIFCTDRDIILKPTSLICKEKYHYHGNRDNKKTGRQSDPECFNWSHSMTLPGIPDISQTEMQTCQNHDRLKPWNILWQKLVPGNVCRSKEIPAPSKRVRRRLNDKGFVNE